MELFPEFLQSGRLRIPENEFKKPALVRANKQKKGTSSFDLHSETINMLQIRMLLEQ